MNVTGQNYIGSRPSALGSHIFQTVNPKTNTSNPWQFTEATAEEIDVACQLASEAFVSYRQVSGQERAEFLKTIATLLHENRAILIEHYCLESGLDERRAKLELERTVKQLISYGDFVRRTDWSLICSEDPQYQEGTLVVPGFKKKYVPLGPVLVFGSSNFPFAYSTAGGDTASALAAGCPVVVKSHPMHAATGELVAVLILRAAQQCSMPEGVFSNLNGSSFEPGRHLVRNSNIKALGFTGSLQGGRALMDLAAARPEPIPVYAEMGSVNPVFISNESVLRSSELWAKKYADSITQGTGQFCTNPGLIFLENNALNHEFAEVLAREIEERTSTCMLHPAIKQRFDLGRQLALSQAGVMRLSSDVLVEGINFAEQTLLWVHADQFERNPNLHQEVFGPFSLVVFYDDLSQLTRIVEQLEGQLTSTIIIEQNEFSAYQQLIEKLRFRTGRLIFNGVPTGVEVTDAMHHGGPYPATSDPRFTAVGIHAVLRWVRPIVYQNFPEVLIP